MLQERMKQGNAYWKEEIEQQTEGKTNKLQRLQTNQTNKKTTTTNNNKQGGYGRKLEEGCWMMKR